jgi:CubicO group peptidase (beta-lactamase class C family)
MGHRHCDRGLAKRLDATLDFIQAAQGGGGGVQAVLVRNGRVLWSAERGVAILDPPASVDRHTLFAFGSFGKLMLSAFALDRVESGALDLDAPISKYVGDSVPGSRVVTVRTLLTHTAGYAEVYDSAEVGPFFGDQYDPNREWSFATLLPGIHDPVDPGARWEYSNTGYIVLAHVLDAITPGPLERAYIRFVWRAGLTERELTMQRSPFALSRFAHGYVGTGSSLSDSFAGAAGIPTDLYGLPFGDGAFAGTALGAARFLDALFVRGRLLPFDSVRQMIEPTPQSLAAGPQREMQNYGMGTASYNAAGRVWHGHDGTHVGFTTMGATDLQPVSRSPS